jgi:hypothetical protein
MAFWQDGTSNQILVGEKHILPEDLGKCLPNASAQPEINSAGDCSYLYIGYWRTSASARPITRGFSGYTVASDNAETAGTGNFSNPEVNLIASYPNMPYGGQNLESSRFGSWHAGVCNFLIGDGSVHALSVTIAKLPYHYWGYVDDGNAVQP